MKNLLLFVISLLIPSFLFAEELITVTVSGYGATPEAAEKSALQKAVRKAVGEMVDAETLAQNGELIKDEVLSYSDGFVQSKKTISGPEKDEDLGFFAITIEAKVLPKKLAAKLEEAKITTSAVAGEDIWAQAVSKISNVFEGREMLAKLVNEEIIPARLLKARLISPGPDGKPLYDDQAKIEQKIDYDAETVEMTYMVEMRWDREAYLESIVPRMTALLDKLAVAPPVEVRGPLYKTKTQIYPNGENCYAALRSDVLPEDAFKGYTSNFLKLNSSVLLDIEAGPGADGKYNCSYPDYKGTEFRAVWSEEHFFVLVDTSTKEDEFSVLVYTLKGDEYYKVFYQNNDYTRWVPTNDYSKMVSDGSGAQTRPTVFPYLVIELVDESGTPLGSRLIEDWDALVSEYNPAPATSLLAKLNSSKTMEPKEYNPAGSRYLHSKLKRGYKQKDFHQVSRFASKPELPRGMPSFTGFFEPIEIRNNGKVGCAHLTMPKFFLDNYEDKGMSNSHVFKTTLTLPHEDTKRIKKVNLFWLDNSYMNSHNTKGSLKPDDKTRGIKEEALLSGKTGLSFKYTENDLIVDQVAPNSPADSTGKIALGDTVIGFANPADLDEKSYDGPIHWDPFSKLDKKNAKENFSNYFSSFARNYGIDSYSESSVISQIKKALEEDAAPLELVADVLTSGPPDTFVYLLIRPKANPNERVIVPIRRKVL